MARLVRLGLVWLVLIALGVAAYLYAREYIRRHPQDVPWTPLRLDDPIGRFTLSKLARLSEHPAQCGRLIRQAGARHVAAPPLRSGEQCGYDDGMRLAGDGARFAPAGVVTSCPVAAGMTILERQVLQPAALRHFGSPVVVIEHAGSYSCRRMYGRADGPWSEHATADAIDLVGFRLADGRRIRVVTDWAAGEREAAFLRDVRDGACGVFATTLSPDYNRAHADHLHLDLATRGRFGFGLCR